MEPNITMPGADTLVILSTQKKYMMHSAQLKQCSRLLNKMLAAPATPLSREAQRNGSPRYLICLQDHNEHTNAKIQPIFRRLPLDTEGNAARPVSKIYEDEDNHYIRPGLFGDYDKLFRAFCNRAFRLNVSTIASLFQDCVGLVEIAQRLGSTHVIAKTVDNALLTKGQALFQAIATDPVTWIKLAYNIQSKVMFKESLIHLTGKYNALSKTDPDTSFAVRYPMARSKLDQLDPEIRGLLEKKNAQLKKACRHVEVQVMTHYPSQITKEFVTGRADRDDIGRAAYGRDIFAWISVSLYRHWCGQKVASDGTHHATDGGRDFYAKLHAGGQAYLTRESTQQFHANFPMSTKGKSVLEHNLDIVKTGVKDIVAPLLKNESQLDVTTFPVKWLTCVDVKQEDYIWEIAVVERDQGKRKRKAHEALEDSE